MDRRTFLKLSALPLVPACGERPADPDARWIDADGPWASGGTVAMTDKDSYPDPFTDPITTCALVAAATAGPCSTETDLVREDISEGWAGLPVRLALKVVDTACNPIAGATVKVWHTNRAGIYSGETPAPDFCSSNDAEAIAADYMRGVQTTAADGTVFFDTCFPGWYVSRAIHIHFQVSSGGTTYRVSQLYFSSSVISEIFASHPDYVAYGQPNVLNAEDGNFGAIPAAEREAVTMDHARMTDGAMLAWKVVAVTS